MEQREFIRVVPLAKIFGFAPGTIYNSHATGRGPLAPILTKFGNAVGAWRGDVEALIAAERRLPDPQPADKQAAA
jgi:hypothetical protein